MKTPITRAPLTDAQRALAERNYRLVLWGVSRVLKRYTRIDEADAWSLAGMALIRTVQDWNPAKATLATHYAWKLKAAASRHLKDSRPLGYRVTNDPMPEVRDLYDDDTPEIPDRADGDGGRSASELAGKILARVDPEDARWLQLRYLDGRRVQQIADALGSDRWTVGLRIGQAVEQARRVAGGIAS
jgi:RNA polymerase sigma factor (sigma-70 family)